MISRKEARNAALGAGLSGASQARELAHANPESAATATERPPLEARARVMAGAVGAVSRTLDQFTHELQAAKDLAASGAQVVELDPADIEDSILKDRLEMEPESQAALVESIRQSGQQVPVLVRRIGHAPDRYQIAYGHRRVAACRQLGRRVLAIIRTLSDQELLVAQGQENSSRKDLSYIERAMFALNLETRGVAREAIMLALSTDKTELSKMISVARSVPGDLVRSIGPAPKAGRTRWLGLSQRLAEVRLDAKFRAALASADFAAASTDARFERVFGLLQAKPRRGAQPLVWANPEGKELVRGARSTKAFTLTIDEAQEPGFGEFLLTHLGALYEEFRSRKAAPG